MLLANAIEAIVKEGGLARSICRQTHAIVKTDRLFV